MVQVARDLIAAALSLPEDERLHIASELIASVEEPQDSDWALAWGEELDCREQAVREGGPEGSTWPEVRARLLAQLNPRSRGC